jgi:tRNA (guanine37-N1)-methyltransferase
VPFFAILTLFPEALEAYAATGMLGIARRQGALRLELIDLRDFTRDPHRTVDDRPFGGGPGMVLRPEPIADCVEWLEQRHGPFRRIALCPGGRTFRQCTAEEFAREERLLLLCGRYEGFDERVREALAFEDLSVGDYVLSGGELPSLVVCEAAARLLPGVLGNAASTESESFSGRAGGLDFPHYTRPRVWRGRAVPEVLLSGNHQEIEAWRLRAARARTSRARPDLLGATPFRTPLSDVPHDGLP